MTQQTVKLGKGQRVNLSKQHPSANFITVMLDWDVNRFSNGPKHDADLTGFAARAKPAGGHELVHGMASMCFYNNHNVGNGAMVHSGDDNDGSKREFITIDTAKVNVSEVSEIALVSTIHKYKSLGLNFGMFENAHVKVFVTDVAPDLNTIVSLQPAYTFDLTEDMSTLTSAQLISVYHKPDAATGQPMWSLTPIGAGYANGLGDFCRYYGLQVEDEDDAL